MKCPVCGHDSAACVGPTHATDVITVSGVVKRTGPERVPRQRKGIGRAGYVGERTGKVEVYEPGAPNLRLVVPDDTEPETDNETDGEPAAVAEDPPAAITDEPVAPRRRRRKADE